VETDPDPRRDLADSDVLDIGLLRHHLDLPSPCIWNFANPLRTHCDDNSVESLSPVDRHVNFGPAEAFPASAQVEGTIPGTLYVRIPCEVIKQP
jgi:hypothetical protein